MGVFPCWFNSSPGHQKKEMAGPAGAGHFVYTTAMPQKEDFSYGVIPVFKHGDDWQVLVVHQISYRGDDFWILPKGHAEAEETPQQAAKRELQEETGVSEVALVSEPTFEITYTFTHEGERIHKTVTYFLGFCETTNTMITQPNEIKDLQWCSISKGKELLTHQNSIDVLMKVEDYLSRI